MIGTEKSRMAISDVPSSRGYETYDALILRRLQTHACSVSGENLFRYRVVAAVVPVLNVLL